MNKRINLLVIFGGRSGEHAISLMSARSVMDAINREKYQINLVGISQNGSWYTAHDILEQFEAGIETGADNAILVNENKQAVLYSRRENQLQKLAKIDVAFPVLHGSFGEDGSIQGLFEIKDLAFVGSGVLASSVCMDKAFAKGIVAGSGLPIVPYTVITRRELGSSPEAAQAKAEAVANYPLFVKPANLGSSVGISKVHNASELLPALQKAAKFDRRILVEEGVDAREIEISVLGNEKAIVSEPGEIIPDDEFYSYQDKYYNGEPEACIPARLSEEETQQVKDYALKAYQALDCAGMARVDFFINKKNGKLYFNEINTLPGFTKISMYPKLWQASGLAYSKLIDQLIELALERKAENDQTVRKFED